MTNPTGMPRTIGDGVTELMVGGADPLPTCRSGQTLRVSLDGARPVLRLGSSAAHISDVETMDRLIIGLITARRGMQATS